MGLRSQHIRSQVGLQATNNFMSCVSAYSWVPEHQVCSARALNLREFEQTLEAGWVQQHNGLDG